MPTSTDTDEDDESRPFDPASLTPVAELPPSSAPRPQWLTPEEGAVWGDFRLGEMLGQGGMGMVFKAHQISLNRTVALKVLTPYLGSSASFRSRFLREAQSVARIASPHVVQVYAAGTHGDFQYFGMEFVDGEDLGSKLAAGYRPSRAEALEIMIQAARGLVAAGEHDIVHRDIKPGNMMITRRGVVKLMDFGLVRIASEERMTTTGVIMGTPYYFSPEQARGEDCDQRADVYSLGIVFYELLTGELPFTGDQSAVVYAHINTRPRKPRELDRDIPAEWQEVVLACLAKKPEARYRSAAELLRDLERLAAEQAPALAAPPANPWPARAGAAAALLVAATASAWTLRPTALTDRMAAGTVAPMHPVAQTTAVEPDQPPATAAPATPPAPAAPAAAERAPDPEPTVLADPPPVTAICETTATVHAPFVGSCSAYRWSIEGSCGHLDAEATLGDTTTWCVPGRPGEAILRVTGISASGHEVNGAVRLKATSGFKPRQLLPFASWPAAEPAAARLAQDARGIWWSSDPGERRLWARAPGWFGAQAHPYNEPGSYAPPVALRWSGDGLLALDRERGRLLEFDAHGGFIRSRPIEGAPPLDLAVTRDGKLLVADAARGLRLFAADGRPLPGTAAGSARFVRVAVAPNGEIAALDAGNGRVERFGATLETLAAKGALKLELRGDDTTVDLAYHAEGLVVLLANGAALVVGADGRQRRIERTALAHPRSPAGGLAVGALGEAIVSWPGDAMLSRLPLGGWTEAVRGGAARRATACAADGTGRVWSLVDDVAMASDAQGWFIRRIDAAEIGLPQPEQIAVSPDGTRLALAGPHRVVIDLAQPSMPAHEPPAPNEGWPQSPRLALDLHRLYVLDPERSCLQIAEMGGKPTRCACPDLAHPARIAVSPSGSIVYVADADGLTLAKYVLDETRTGIERAERAAAHDLRLQRVDAIGCDLQGQLYALDQGSAVRIVSWLSGPAQPGPQAILESLALPPASAMAVSPDGQVWLGSRDALVGLRW